MRTIDISTRLLSDAVWRRILECAEVRLAERRQEFFTKMAALEALRSTAAYNTGSIPASSAWLMYALTHYFRPQRIAEVGTFIGRSTLAMAMGCDDSGSAAEIHTCDGSNSIELPRFTRCALVQYPQTTSVGMFTRMCEEPAARAAVELVNIDGRLQQEDLNLLRQLLTPDAVVALDDFEGLEKGVANLALMRSAAFLPAHLLVYPCSTELLGRFGFVEAPTVALLVPQSGIRLTPQ